MNCTNNALKFPVGNESKKRLSIEVPVWEKYALTITEAAQYFSIGENKLRNHINEHKNAKYVIWSGSHVLIKRKLFEVELDTYNVI